jgi:putative NADH-flavin reductase
MRTILSLLVMTMLITSSGHAAPPEAHPMKIGIVGAGHIGGTLAKLWVAAGHEVLLSSRHPGELRALAKQLGPRARVGPPREAASFGDVVLVSVPYKAPPELGGKPPTEVRFRNEADGRCRLLVGGGAGACPTASGIRRVRAKSGQVSVLSPPRPR